MRYPSQHPYIRCVIELKENWDIVGSIGYGWSPRAFTWDMGPPIDSFWYDFVVLRCYKLGFTPTTNKLILKYMVSIINFLLTLIWVSFHFNLCNFKCPLIGKHLKNSIHLAMFIVSNILNMVKSEVKYFWSSLKQDFIW